MELPFAEAWKIKMVEPIKKSTREEREKWLEEAHQNIFMLKSDYVYIDLLTDSGTGAMSDRQWSAMMMGDESYGGARSFYHMKDTITELTGFEFVIPTHQGRAAENVLFSYLVKPGQVIPGNAHFDTTKGHIESRKAFAIDVTVPEAYDTQLEVPFKGNVSLEKLEKVSAGGGTLYTLPADCWRLMNGGLLRADGEGRWHDYRLLGRQRSKIEDYNAVVEAASKFTRSVAEGNRLG